MAEKLEDGDLWPPMEFLGKGFFFEKRRAATLMPEIVERSGLVRENLSFSSSNMAMEAESDEEDCVAGLARQMAQYSFLAEDNTPSFWDTRILATSPQSTLCDAGIWSAACGGNPNICSKASPRLSAFQEQRKEDAMDILYAAAGELLRTKNEQRVSERYQMKNPLVNTKSSQIAGSHNNQSITRQQIQAAQFYKLKQQLLMKQQVSSAWSAQNRVATATSNRPHGLAPPAWCNLQKPQPNPGMRAIFLNASGTRRESAGTGVFLPRRAGSPTAKKPACSTVLLPARVVQALNLNLDDAGVNPRYPVHFPRVHETQSARAKPVYNEQKRHFYQPPPASISGEEIRLPNEWTY